MFMRFLGIGVGHCNQHTTEAEVAELERGVGDDSQTCMDDHESDTEGADLDTEDDEDGLDGTDSDDFDDDDFGYDNL